MEFSPARRGNTSSDISLFARDHPEVGWSGLHFCLAHPDGAWATYSDKLIKEVTFQGPDSSEDTLTFEEGCGCVYTFRMDDLMSLNKALSLANEYVAEGRLFIHPTSQIAMLHAVDVPEFIQTCDDFPPIGPEVPLGEVVEFCNSSQPWSTTRRLLG